MTAPRPHSAGLPTWVERLLIAAAFAVGLVLVIWVLAVALAAAGVHLPTLDDGN